MFNITARHPATVALDQLQRDAASIRSKGSMLAAEIATLEKTRDELEASGDIDDAKLDAANRLTGKLRILRKQLDGTETEGDVFRLLNGPRGVEVVNGLVAAMRDGLKKIEEDHQKTCLKILTASCKGEPSALNAERIYTAADECAKVLEVAQGIRQSIAAGESAALSLPSARMQGGWGFNEAIERMAGGMGTLGLF